MSIPTGIKDINGRLVHTGQKVKMHYFLLGLGDFCLNNNIVFKKSNKKFEK